MTQRGKDTKIMVLANTSGLLLGEHIVSSNPHEITLIEALLDALPATPSLPFG